ncbi:MAG: 2-dehydropantoate 2-reductase [Caldilineales bacterium]
MDSSSRILIVGSGALATLFGARLAAAGNAVTLLGTWPEALTALNTYGARLTAGDSGSEQAWPVHAVDDSRQCHGIRYALVLVKAWQTARAAAQLAECLADDGVALTLQNGWGNREQLQEVLGPARVAAGVTTLGATLLKPGRVRAAGNGPITVGEHPALPPLLHRLSDAGFTVASSTDIDGLLWGKLVINAAINPLTAIMRIRNGKLLEEPLRGLASIMAEEAAATGRARGLQLPFADATAAMLEVAQRTADNYSSMCQDLLNERPTEIDAINGVVAREAERLGVLAPNNHAFWYLISNGLTEVLQ